MVNGPHPANVTLVAAPCDADVGHRRSCRGYMLHVRWGPTSVSGGGATIVSSAGAEHDPSLAVLRKAKAGGDTACTFTHAWSPPVSSLSDDRKRWTMFPLQLMSRSWPHLVMRMSGTAKDVGAICYGQPPASASGGAGTSVPSAAVRT